MPDDDLPPRRDPDDPATWRTARHEAGHAVAAIALRRSFDHVTLRPRDPRYAGVLIGHRMRPHRLAGIVVQLAGCLAVPENDELHHTDWLRLYCTRGRTDLDNIDKYAVGLSQGSIERLTTRAFHIVGVSHREAVAAVAAALVEHPQQRLTHGEVAEIVRDWRPGGLNWLLQRSTEQLAERRQWREAADP